MSFGNIEEMGSDSSLSTGKHIKSEPWSNIEYLKTVGTDYTIIPSFAKFNDFQADIYNDLISPHFEGFFTSLTQSHFSRRVFKL